MFALKFKFFVHCNEIALALAHARARTTTSLSSTLRSIFYSTLSSPAFVFATLVYPSSSATSPTFIFALVFKITTVDLYRQPTVARVAHPFLPTFFPRTFVPLAVVQPLFLGRTSVVFSATVFTTAVALPSVDLPPFFRSQSHIVFPLTVSPTTAVPSTV